MLRWLRRPNVSSDALERSYAHYVTRTRADWLAFVVVAVVMTTKVPYLTLLIPYEIALWLSLATVVMPTLAIILGVTRARKDFVRILRGRSSWSIAILCGLAFGVFVYVEHVAFIHALRATVLPMEDFGGGAFELLSYVVFIPLIEEFIFQVALQTRLSRFGPVVSILLTTIAFSLFHLDDLSRFPANEQWDQVQLFCGLLMFAILRRYNGSLVGVIVAHGSSNWLTLLFHS